MSGQGTIYSYTVMQRADPPYAIANVTLSEGPTMMTYLVDCDFDTLAVGQPVELVCHASENGTPVPCFTPASAANLDDPAVDLMRDDRGGRRTPPPGALVERAHHTGQVGGKFGLRFSRCEASPSRASAPANPSISKAVEASNVGPAIRSQLLRAYFVHRIAL